MEQRDCRVGHSDTNVRCPQTWRRLGTAHRYGSKNAISHAPIPPIFLRKILNKQWLRNRPGQNPLMIQVRVKIFKANDLAWQPAESKPGSSGCSLASEEPLVERLYGEYAPTAVNARQTLRNYLRLVLRELGQKCGTGDLTSDGPLACDNLE